MIATRVSVLAALCVLSAHADFSYTQTRKPAQGTTGAGDQTTKHYFKGQKMKTEGEATSSILDFDAQTLTTMNHQAKTYTVTPFSELGQAMRKGDVDAKVDVNETGQRKNINGFNASEVIMTVTLDTPQTAQMGLKMQVEMDMWLSQDVPGAQELRAFYQKNMDHFPWAAMAGGGAGNPSMQKAVADMQKKMASLGGVAVSQVMRVKMGGNDGQTPQVQPGMMQARAQLEAMRSKGGPQAAAAEQALARMGGMGGSAKALVEITMESSGFSTNSIPASVFAIPDGYQKK
jgi:hypothetical protein